MDKTIRNKIIAAVATAYIVIMGCLMFAQHTVGFIMMLPFVLAGVLFFIYLIYLMCFQVVEAFVEWHILNCILNC